MSKSVDVIIICPFAVSVMAIVVIDVFSKWYQLLVLPTNYENTCQNKK